MSLNSENGSSKADTLIKVVLVFFISLLSFSVGTFVGHQFSKSEQRRMALEGEYKVDRNVASTGEAAGEDEKISEKEVESLTEEFVNKEKGTGEGKEAAEGEEAVAANEHGEKPEAKAEEGYKSYPRTPASTKEEKPAAAVAHAPVAEHEEEHAAAKPAAHAEEHAAAKEHGEEHAKPAPVKAAAKPSTAAEKVANDKAPSDGAKETRKVSSALPAVASSAIGKFTVQVASYADEAEAKTHAATLKSKGWSAFYVPAAVQGRTWYRVSVGIYDSNKAATEARTQFMKDTNSKSALVQKIIQ